MLVDKLSYLKSVNVDYIEEIFNKYITHPEQVEETWRAFFEGIELGTNQLAMLGEAALAPNGEKNSHATSDLSALDIKKELSFLSLLRFVRSDGFKLARLNPLESGPEIPWGEILARHGLSAADLSSTFVNTAWVLGKPGTLKEALDTLAKSYSGTVYPEWDHVTDSEKREWLRAKIESGALGQPLDQTDRKIVYEQLLRAEGFERFLHTRYVAQKRFSVEGSEAVIPALDRMFDSGARLGAEAFVIGMAHRGRLNVLVNTMGKTYEQMFTEFEGKYSVDPSWGEGDVKYHKGYTRDFTTRKSNKRVSLSLAFNPSHLEFVNAVAMGMARAKQDRRKDKDRTKVVAVLIHGDAAIAGQGVCYETAQMMNLPGYETGGTIHIVINNQVGFTTGAHEAKSSRFSSDLGVLLRVPVFHVNGDDPEALLRVMDLAMEYRSKFKQDIFIDLISYRKHGHNEGDEPSFTQPVMYQKIKAHPSPREIFEKKILSEGSVTEAEVKVLQESLQKEFQAAQDKAKSENHIHPISTLEASWSKYKQPMRADLFQPIKTEVSESKLKLLGAKLSQVPAGFNVHPKLIRVLESRSKSVADGVGLDWGTGEALAFASLLDEGHPIRITGQDAERGTFSHRHAVLSDVQNGAKYSPLKSLSQTQGEFHIYNSFLSETGVMGYEHGYALSQPEALTIWEAQFGDFSNGAQVIIDQFLATSESKWRRMSGLTLLLPHGFEGQGPEHSSARLERFLQLSGKENWFVCNLTTPAQIFHVLRRQVKAQYRKPLVIMSPKSLLRHPLAVSTIQELSLFGFQEVIGDTSVVSSQVKRVLICSGKIYYELIAKRTELSRQDVAIVRLEQIYPFPDRRLSALLSTYPAQAEIVWVQEEPRNMGAWGFVFQTWMGGLSEFKGQVYDRAIRYVGREVAASPAVGAAKVHESEQKALIEKAFQ